MLGLLQGWRTVLRREANRFRLGLGVCHYTFLLDGYQDLVQNSQSCMQGLRRLLKKAQVKGVCCLSKVLRGNVRCIN